MTKVDPVDKKGTYFAGFWLFVKVLGYRFLINFYILIGLSGNLKSRHRFCFATARCQSDRYSVYDSGFDQNENTAQKHSLKHGNVNTEQLRSGLFCRIPHGGPYR